MYIYIVIKTIENMKKVFTTSSQVIHLFAQRSQDEARCNNVYFNDLNRIYSYGRHYLLGEFITNDKEQLAIMIDNSGYSSTTAGHISEITGATRQYKQFFTLSTNLDHVLGEIENNVKKLQNARKPELCILPSQRLFDSLNEFITWTGNKTTKKHENYKKIVSLMKIVNNSDIQDSYLARIKRDELKAKKAAAAKLLTDIQKFENYEINRFSSDQDFVRLSPDQQFVETSQSVKVPVKEAKTLYKLIQAKKDIKGFQISDYTVISINGTLKIGCHNINIESMHKTGSKLLDL